MLGQASALLSRRFWPFFVLALITGIPLIAATALLPGAMRDLLMEGTRSIFEPDHQDQRTEALAGILEFFLYSLSQAVILHAAIQEMRGRPARIVASFRHGLARLFPIAGLAISLAIMLGVGFLLLVVPALYFFAMFYVALLVCVIERLGPIESMGRSAALTKGHRWQIVGLVLVLVVGGFVFQIAVALGIAVAGYPVIAVALASLAKVLFNTFQSVAVTVCYRDLRAAREGIDIEGMATVFD